MSTLVIDTRAPAPRKVGGGLDDPTSTHRPAGTARAEAGQATRTRPTRRRTPTARRTQPFERAYNAPGHDDRTQPGHPEPAPPVDREAAPAPAVGVLSDQAAVEDLATIHAALAALVPAGHTLTTPRLVQMVTAKLASHGPHCAANLNPPRGSLTVDEARAQCRAILDAFDPVERHAVLALVTHDVRAATR